jgi:8-oxo-dGTP pyrophosphatase MutT (NUDIX family)
VTTNATPTTGEIWSSHVHSLMLVSPTNQVVLLHRVKTSRSFASAHVFPGGNLDAFHDGEVAAAGAPERHVDGPAYRLAAIRECFEESGILLARREGGGPLLDLPAKVREQARKDVHANRVRFRDWLKGVGGEPDLGIGDRSRSSKSPF